jgi:hypothetical protein
LLVQCSREAFDQRQQLRDHVASRAIAKLSPDASAGTISRSSTSFSRLEKSARLPAFC